MSFLTKSDGQGGIPWLPTRSKLLESAKFSDGRKYRHDATSLLLDRAAPLLYAAGGEYLAGATARGPFPELLLPLVEFSDAWEAATLPPE